MPKILDEKLGHTARVSARWKWPLGAQRHVVRQPALAPRALSASPHPGRRSPPGSSAAPTGRPVTVQPTHGDAPWQHSHSAPQPPPAKTRADRYPTLAFQSPCRLKPGMAHFAPTLPRSAAGGTPAEVIDAAGTTPGEHAILGQLSGMCGALTEPGPNQKPVPTAFPQSGRALQMAPPTGLEPVTL